jgi:hypothetical protein
VRIAHTGALLEAILAVGWRHCLWAAVNQVRVLARPLFGTGLLWGTFLVRHYPGEHLLAERAALDEASRCGDRRYKQTECAHLFFFLLFF